jgi:hypothetical protein
MKIPNAERAVVDIVKLRDYALNPNHLRGGHKARVFASALELTVDDAEWLQKVLLAEVQSENAVLNEQDEYGQRYTLDFTMNANGKQAIIRSGWIIRAEEDFPRLTTCFVI